MSDHWKAKESFEDYAARVERHAREELQIIGILRRLKPELEKIEGRGHTRSILVRLSGWDVPTILGFIQVEFPELERLVK